jgi:hypothetical protein
MGVLWGYAVRRPWIVRPVFVPMAYVLKQPAMMGYEMVERQITTAGGTARPAETTWVAVSTKTAKAGSV